MFRFGGSSCLLGFNSLTSQCCGQGKWRFCAQFYPQAWRTPYIPPHWLVKGVFVILFHLYTQPLDSKYFFKEIFFAKNSSCNLCTYFLISLSSSQLHLDINQIGQYCIVFIPFELLCSKYISTIYEVLYRNNLFFFSLTFSFIWRSKKH